jgi:hypothetical protein
MNEIIKDRLQEYEDEGYVFALYDMWIIVLERTPNTATNEHLDPKVFYGNRFEVVDFVHRIYPDNHIDKCVCNGLVYETGEIVEFKNFDYESGIRFYNSYENATKFLPFWFNKTNSFPWGDIQIKWI